MDFLETWKAKLYIDLETNICIKTSYDLMVLRHIADRKTLYARLVMLQS